MSTPDLTLMHAFEYTLEGEILMVVQTQVVAIEHMLLQGRLLQEGTADREHQWFDVNAFALRNKTKSPAKKAGNIATSLPSYVFVDGQRVETPDGTLELSSNFPGRFKITVPPTIQHYGTELELVVT